MTIQPSEQNNNRNTEQQQLLHSAYTEYLRLQHEVQTLEREYNQVMEAQTRAQHALMRHVMASAARQRNLAL